MIPPGESLAVQWTLVLVQVGTFLGLLLYVAKTWQMASATKKAAEAAASTVKEMQAARIAAQGPRVSVYFSSPDSHLATVILRNKGLSAAEDVRITFEPPLRSSRDNIGVRFFETAKTLPAEFELSHLFDSWIDYFAADLPKKYLVKVSFKRADTGERVESLQTLDAGGFEHMHFVTRDGLHQLVEKVGRLEAHVTATRNERRSAESLRQSQSELGILVSPQLDGIRSLRLVWTILCNCRAEGSITPDSRGFFAVMRSLAALARHQNSGQTDTESRLDELYILLTDARRVRGISTSAQYAEIESSLSAIEQSRLPSD